MDFALIPNMLLQQATDLIDRQQTVSSDELAEEIINCCSYFVLRRHRDAMASHPNPSLLEGFESLMEATKYAGVLSNEVREVAIDLFKNNYSLGDAHLLHEEVLLRISDENAWEHLKKYFWEKHMDDIGDWWC